MREKKEGRFWGGGEGKAAFERNKGRQILREKKKAAFERKKSGRF